MTEMTEVVLRKPGLHHRISSGLSDADISMCSCSIYSARAYQIQTSQLVASAASTLQYTIVLHL